MTMKRVDPCTVSTNSVLDSITVCYIRFLDLLYAATGINED